MNAEERKLLRKQAVNIVNSWPKWKREGVDQYIKIEQKDKENEII